MKEIKHFFQPDKKMISVLEADKIRQDSNSETHGPMCFRRCRWFLVVFTDRNNLVRLAIQVTQFLDLLFESTLMLVLSTETKTELNNRK